MIDLNNYISSFREKVFFDISFFIKDYLYHFNSGREIIPSASFLNKLNKKENTTLNKLLQEIKSNKINILQIIDKLSDIIYKKYERPETTNFDFKFNELITAFEKDFSFIEDKDPLEFSVTINTPDFEPKIEVSSETSPLQLTISELQKRAEKRRLKMKGFNYSFAKQISNNIEKEPAYKRIEIEISEVLEKLNSIDSKIEKLKKI